MVDSTLQTWHRFFSSPPNFPFRVNWDITYKCNIRCAHCFVIYQDVLNGKVNESAQMRNLIAEEIVRIRPFAVSVAGGEPFTIPEIADILAKLANKRRSVIVATNGHLLSKELVTKLSRLPNFAIQVSLDGATRESHESIRGDGAYQKVMTAIDLIVSHVPLTVACTLTRLSCHEIYKLCELSSKLGVSAIKLQPYIKTPSVPESTLAPSYADLQQAAHQLDLFVSKRRNCALQLFHPFNNLTAGLGTQHLTFDSACPSFKARTECTVTPLGDVVLCGAALDKGVCWGNIGTERFAFIWRRMRSETTKETQTEGEYPCNSF